MLHKIFLSGFQSENIKSQAAAYYLLSDFQGNQNLI